MEGVGAKISQKTYNMYFGERSREIMKGGDERKEKTKKE